MKMFFSGVEGQHHFQACMDAKVRHVLTSYLYMEKNDPNTVKLRKRKHPEIEYMVDSGAHTFQSDKKKYGQWSLQDYEHFLDRYVKWIRANRAYICACVELDIDWIVGTNVVEAWQKKYFYPLLEEGIEVIFVWHKQRGFEVFEEMCSRFPYVGLPGEFSAEPDFNKYVTVARRYTTKLHGFAAAKQADLRDWPWCSGDAITWKTCEIYGTLIHWDASNRKLVFEQSKEARAQYRKHFIAAGLNADAIINDTDYKEVTKYALHSMRAMEQYYEEKYADRIWYYSLRLPHPRSIPALSKPQVLHWWKDLLRCDQLWRSHADGSPPDVSQVRRHLAAIAAVQYRDETYLRSNKGALDFLQPYFPKMVGPPLGDLQTFQKELATYIAPPNVAPLERAEAGHYVAMNNPPKQRTEKEFSLEELEHQPIFAITAGWEL